MEHVLSAGQFAKEELEKILDLAEDISKNPKKYENAIHGKIVSTLFYEPSTRTRLSFESAILRVGGKVISTENAKVASSAVKGESIKDTIRVTAGYADAIVIRHKDVNSANDAASVSNVPILNAGSGSGEHPTQALLDMFTIRQNKGKIEGLKVVVCGDLRYGRTVHSLIQLLSLYDNVKIYGLSRKSFKLPEKYIEMLKDKNIEYIECSEFKDIPIDIDVIYHTRTQKERFEGDQEIEEEYIIDQKVLDMFPNTILLHPLPRVEEISEEVDDDKRALYFKQAHNGVFIRMALLVILLSKN